MKIIKPKEELEIIQNLIHNGEFIDRGSSRAVYKLEDGIVYKVAVDDAGRTQNNAEINFYKMYGNQYLAEIYFYGRYLIAMEEVEVKYSSSDLEDYRGGYYEDDEESSAIGNIIPFEEENYEIQEAIEFLDGELGHTSDNYQIGYSIERDTWVAYDYGYDPGTDRKSQISDLLMDRVDFDGPEYVLETTAEKIKSLLDLSVKILYN